MDPLNTGYWGSSSTRNQRPSCFLATATKKQIGPDQTASRTQPARPAVGRPNGWLVQLVSACLSGGREERVRLWGSVKQDRTLGVQSVVCFLPDAELETGGLVWLAGRWESPIPPSCCVVLTAAVKTMSAKEVG